jgi:DNA-binding IclR family transcriptional regulator
MSNTTTDADQLRSEIERMRDRGFAVFDEEFRAVCGRRVSPPRTRRGVSGTPGVGESAYRIRDAHLYGQIPKLPTEAAAELEREIAGTVD